MPGGHKQAAFAGEGEAVVVARAIEQLEHAIPAPAPPVGPCLNAPGHDRAWMANGAKERVSERHALQNSTTIFGERPPMRRLILSALFVIAALVFLHQANHAHAHEPTRCGFWSSMEAGMSCR